MKTPFSMLIAAEEAKPKKRAANVCLLVSSGVCIAHIFVDNCFNFRFFDVYAYWLCNEFIPKYKRNYANQEIKSWLNIRWGCGARGLMHWKRKPAWKSSFRLCKIVTHLYSVYLTISIIWLHYQFCALLFAKLCLLFCVRATTHFKLSCSTK